MKFRDLDGQFKDIVIKTGDTLPVGSVVEYEGSTPPAGWSKLSDGGSVIVSGEEPTTGEEVWIDNVNKKIHTKTDNGYEEFYSEENIVNLIYPVGSIYMSVNNSNPSNLFGGIWEQLEDRFLLGAGNIYSNGATGGYESHIHNLPIGQGFTDDKLYVMDASSYSNANGSFNGNAYGPSDRDISWGGKQYTTYSSSSMPPYLTVYMWKRIS